MQETLYYCDRCKTRVDGKSFIRDVEYAYYDSSTIIKDKKEVCGGCMGKFRDMIRNWLEAKS